MSAKEGPHEVGIEARLLPGWRQLTATMHSNRSEPAA